MDQTNSDVALWQGALGSRRGPKTVASGTVISSLLKQFRSEAFVVSNVTITGDIDLRDADIAGHVVFRQCDIARILTTNARFRNGLRISGSDVRVWDGERTTLEGQLKVIRSQFGAIRLANSSMVQCFFAGGIGALIDISSSDVASDLRLSVPVRMMNLARTRINGYCRLDRSVAVNLVLRGVRAYRVYCRNLLAEEANFDGVFAEDDMDCEGITVTKHLNMIAAKVGDTLKFDGAKLGGIILSRITCGGLLTLREMTVCGTFSILGGTVDAFNFSGRVDGEMRIADVSFRLAYFRGLRVLGDMTFERNSIAGILSIQELSSIKSTFHEKVSLSGCHVGSQVLISNVEANADFALNSMTASDIGISDSIFRGSLSLNGSSVGGVMFLNRVTVAHDVQARYATASLVRMEAADVATSIDMEQFVVKGSCILAVETARQNLAHVSIGGALHLEQARLSQALDLSHARVGELSFRRELVEYSDEFVFPPYVALRECHYNTLHVAWRTMVDALDRRTVFDATAYDNLERYMRRRGRIDWADEIYYFGRRRATLALPKGTKRNTQRLLEWISGYGAKPRRLLRAAGIVCLLMFAGLIYCAWMSPIVVGAQAVHDADVIRHTVRLLAHSGISTFDVLIRGDRSEAMRYATNRSALRIDAVLDVVIALRYIFLALIGLWAAYITGLIRYAGTADRRG